MQPDSKSGYAPVPACRGSEAEGSAVRPLDFPNTGG